ncbi:unnamed protein product [Rhizoctonia solani]|uniref:Protein kinase domain-containing protein n=1 Tax=Rhizoctonia solani TaxID=456999 RepID=A0A8H2X4X9_9AGAM|nr:unnamed protein product [Rhizoctonia solani]
MAYSIRFERLGDLRDIDKAIEVQSGSVALVLNNNPNLPNGLASLAVSYKNRFTHLGELNDLEKAIKCESHALASTPDGHPRLSGLLANLGTSHRSRFMLLDELGDLEKAIEYQFRALALTPGDHPDLSSRLANLGLFYILRSQRLGKHDDLEKAIEYQSRALALTPDGHPQFSSRLTNLGVYYGIRFQRLDELGDLEKAIEYQSRALALTPDGHPDLSIRLPNLGVSYINRLERKNTESRLNEAFKLHNCNTLLAIALGSWDNAAVSTPKDYVDMMRLLVRIDNALSYACRVGGAKPEELDFQVRMVRHDAEQIYGEDLGRGPYFLFCFVNEGLRGLSWKEVSASTGRPLATSEFEFYIHTGAGKSVHIHCHQSKQLTIGDVLLYLYRLEGASPVRCGILDNPTFHFINDPNASEHPRRASRMDFTRSSTYLSMMTRSIRYPYPLGDPTPHITVGNNPRVHLLTTFGPRPRFYTLFKPAQESEIISKGKGYTRGNLRSYSRVWKQYTSPYTHYQLCVKLYQLKANKVLGLCNIALIPIKLPETSEYTIQLTLQSLLKIWQQIIELEKQLEETPAISWLIEQKYANKDMQMLFHLATQDQCRIYSGHPGSAQLSHGVLGTVFPRIIRLRLDLGEIPSKVYKSQHALGFRPFVKDIGDIQFSHPRAQDPQTSENNSIAEFVQRCSSYNHPNVLSLEGIIPKCRTGIGLVFCGTDTRSLREYLDTVPDVNRCQLCAQISSGLMYLNEAGVIHGHLRAANILVSLAGEAIISDPFVLGNGKSDDKLERIRWLAPEVLKGEPPSHASDIFSLGMTILEIINDAPPYIGKDDTEVLSNLKSGLPCTPLRPENTIPQNSRDGNDLWNLLLYCWNFDPSNRPHVAHVAEVMRSITQDGLKQEITDTFHFMLRVALVEESPYELSDIASMSGSSTDAGSSPIDGPHISSPIVKDQRVLDPEGHRLAREIVRQLAVHGCENLTDHVDGSTFGQLPLFKGGFGDVFCGTLRGGLRVSVKTPQISLNILEENPDYMKDVAREIHTWSKCDHSNVLHFLGLVEFRGQIGMVAPWMEFGSLPRYLEKALSANRCNLCTQVCEGVAYLHQIGIVHGDLKGENVLVSSEGVAVVSDFGGSLLKNRSLNIVPMEKGLCLTYRWAAPELLMQGGIGQPGAMDDTTEIRTNQTSGKDALNTKESDIYALGMTILVSYW